MAQSQLQLPNIKTLEIPEFDCKPIIPPEKGTKRDHSWYKVDTSKFECRRQSLDPMYNSQFVQRPNFYNRRWRQSTLNMSQTEVEIPQRQQYRSKYIPQDQGLFSQDNPKPRYKRSMSPTIFDKDSYSVNQKSHIRVSNKQKDYFQQSQEAPQYVAQRRQAPNYVRSNRTNNIQNINGAVAGNDDIKQTRRSRRYIPRDNKELFMPFDAQYGLPECRGWTSGYSRPSSNKIQNRSGEQIDQMIKDYQKQESFGLASGVQFLQN